MYRTFACLCCLLSGLLVAQDFEPLTVVCTEGAYVLRSPLADGQAAAYRWERSFDGGTSWSATGTDSPELTISNPNPGIRYRLVYGADAGCLDDTSCRQITSATELSVQVPSFSQGLSRCAGDTVFIGDVALTTEGNHRTVIQTSGGCDSIVNTFLELMTAYDELYFLDRCVGEDVNGIPVQRDTVIVQNFVAASGCDSTVRYDVNVALDANAGLFIDGPLRVCATDEGPELTAPGGYASYRWSSGETTQTIRPANAGTYALTLTDFTDCTRELTHELTIVDLRIDAVNATAPACPDVNSGSLAVLASGDPELLYSIDGGDNFGLADSFTELAPGDYAIVVENPDGCRATSSATIEAAAEMTLSSSIPAEQTIERGDSLPLAVIADFAVAEWTWSPAQWMTDSDTSVTTAYPPVDVEFRVEAMGTGGCAVSDTFRVTVLDSRRYYAPTAFSPNGDDKNDVWRIFPGPRAEAITGLQIADRWGGIRYVQQENELAPDQAGWDGTDQGTPLPPGNYLYSAAIRFTDGSLLPVKGQITLLR